MLRGRVRENNGIGTDALEAIVFPQPSHVPDERLDAEPIKDWVYCCTTDTSNEWLIGGGAEDKEDTSVSRSDI